jgi:alpha-1,3-rhamnosyl/mannosyltransferase
LIAAAKLLLHTKTLPFELVFIGHRRTGLLSRLIQESGVGQVVKDLGTQTTSTVAAHYAASTIVLFPSKCEGFGIPLVEAMQYGKPILAATHKCIQEVGGAAPDYLDPDNPHAWANRIRDLLADNQQLAKMADRSKFESRRFSWENSWKSINPIFQQ